MHFCVRLPGSPGGHLLVNLNIVEHAPPRGRASRVARVIALGTWNGWSGHVDSFAIGDVDGAAGAVDIRFGSTSLAWEGDAFALRMQAGALGAQLHIRPLMLPSVPSTVSFGPGRAMHWVVIPRLVATGTVTIEGRTLNIAGAPTYHDHNWGHFRWGGDLAWEWGFVTPDAESPWSVVFVRVSDGRGHRTLSQGALVWCDAVNVRSFQNQEIQVVLDGCHAGPRPLTLPPAGGLLAPGAASGVPARLDLRARGEGDELDIAYETASKARIALPNELDDFRVVLLNETAGAARVRGTVRGRAFSFDGPAIVEFVRG
jgi:hypothetical protein